MAHPLGQPSVEVSPGVWEGTTPAGLRRIIGSSFMSSGLLADRTTDRVSGTSGWAYKVPSGAGFAWLTWNAKQGILIPWEETTLNVSPPSGGASRTDVIYVGGDGVLKVREGANTPPASELVIDRMVIPAGATNTSGATSNYDIKWAIPAGGSLGLLASHEVPAGNQSSSTEPRTIYTGRFTVPSDRIVRVDLTTCLRSVDSSPGKGAMVIVIDGTYRRALFASYDSGFNTIAGSWSTTLAEGAHTIELHTLRQSGSAFRTAAGGTTTELNVWDVGVSR